MKILKRSQPSMPARRLERQVSAEAEGAATFRRGRTLTGSASSAVHALSESQADLKSSRVHAHTLTKRRRRLVQVFVVVCCTLGVLYVAISQFTAQAVVQASPDASLQLDSMYADAIDDYFSEHFAQRWRVFTDADTLTSYVQLHVPEVKKVTPRGSAGFGKSSFEVIFREPIASWSVGTRELYVDASGTPFDQNYFQSPSLRITDHSGITSTAPGQSIMSNRFMGYIGQVMGLLKQRGYTVTAISIPEGMTRQIEVQIEGIGYPFKLSSDRPAGEGVEDMVRTIEWMNARQLSPQYVDVRVAGKVFYK